MYCSAGALTATDSSAIIRVPVQNERGGTSCEEPPLSRYAVMQYTALILDYSSPGDSDSGLFTAVSLVAFAFPRLVFRFCAAAPAFVSLAPV